LSIRPNSLYILREDLSLLEVTGIKMAIHRIAAGGRRALLLGLFAVPGPTSTPKLTGASAVLPVLFLAIINSDHGDGLPFRLSVAFQMFSTCVCYRSCPWSSGGATILLSTVLNSIKASGYSSRPFSFFLFFLLSSSPWSQRDSLGVTERSRKPL
jgi:hypothetical protein